jgi:hypothetical protein
VYGLVKGSFLAHHAVGSAGAGLFFLGDAARPAVPDHPGKADGRTRAVGRGMICSPEGAGADGVIVMVAGGKHCTEAGAQARTPPRPLAGSSVKSPLYLAFSALESAFQR